MKFDCPNICHLIINIQHMCTAYIYIHMYVEKPPDRASVLLFTK